MFLSRSGAYIISIARRYFTILSAIFISMPGDRKFKYCVIIVVMFGFRRIFQFLPSPFRLLASLLSSLTQ
jgi:hypothetical protein